MSNRTTGLLTRKAISTFTWIGTESPALQLRNTPLGIVPTHQRFVRCETLRSRHDFGLVLEGTGELIGGLRHFLRVGACRQFELIGLAKGGYKAGQRRGCYASLAVTHFESLAEIPELLVVGKHLGDTVILNPRHAWVFKNAILTRLPDAKVSLGTDSRQVIDHLRLVRTNLRMQDEDFKNQQCVLLAQSERERVVTYCLRGSPIWDPRSIATVLANTDQLTGITKGRKHHH